MLKRFEAAILSLLAGALIYGVAMQTTSDAAMVEDEPIGVEISVHEMAQTQVEYPDYMEMMIRACVIGDFENGQKYAEERDAKIDELGLDQPHVDFYELHLLSKVIWFEAGSSWLSQEWKMKVGEVLLNRVASPEFPDTLADCVYQKNPIQYQKAFSSVFNITTNIDESSVRAAAELLNGKRLINDPSVVFQSNRKLGGGVYEKMCDDTLGVTYLCYSSYPELYE